MSQSLALNSRDWPGCCGQQSARARSSLALMSFLLLTQEEAGCTWDMSGHRTDTALANAGLRCKPATCSDHNV